MTEDEFDEIDGMLSQTKAIQDLPQNEFNVLDVNTISIRKLPGVSWVTKTRMLLTEYAAWHAKVANGPV